MKAKFMFSLVCVAAVTLTACVEYPYGYYRQGYSPYGYYSPYGDTATAADTATPTAATAILRWLWLLATTAATATAAIGTAAIGYRQSAMIVLRPTVIRQSSVLRGPTVLQQSWVPGANGTPANVGYTGANVVINTTIGTKLT